MSLVMAASPEGRPRYIFPERFGRHRCLKGLTEMNAHRQQQHIRPNRTGSVPAVILAGGINRIPLDEDYCPELKALIPFAGNVSIVYVLRALRRSEGIGPVAVVGDRNRIREVLGDAEDIEFLPPGATLLDSIATGLKHFHGAPKVLVTTADLPLLTPEAVEEFLAACAEQGGNPGTGLYWSMVPQGCFLGPFARCRKGYNRFRDISVCHGNLLLVTPSILEEFAVNTPLEALYRARKSSLRCALACGWRVGLGYLFGVLLFRRLSLEQMARLLSGRFRFPLKPVLLYRPEAALDVDEPEDYRLVREQLEVSESKTRSDELNF